MPAEDCMNHVNQITSKGSWIAILSAHLSYESTLDEVLEALERVSVLLAVDLGSRRVDPREQGWPG